MSSEDKNDLIDDIPSSDLPGSEPYVSDDLITDTENQDENMFSADELSEMLSSDEDSVDESAFNSDAPVESINEKPDNSKKIIQGSVLTLVSILAFLFLFTDIFTSTEGTKITSGSNNGLQVMKTQRISSYQPTSTDFRKERTLTQINESEKIIQTIAQMKRDLDNLRKYGQSGDRSQKALRDSQKIISKSLEELHRLTSAKKLSLDDGGFLEPLANGKGYNITSGSGIKNTNNSGTYIVFKYGTILKNKDESSITFVFTNIKSGKTEISNLFKITPRTGLKEITSDHEKNKIKDIVMDVNYINDRIEKFMYEDTVIFFNSLGEISATKKYRQKLYKDTNKNTPILGSIRRLHGFETADYDIYDIKDGTLRKNDKKYSISGFSQDLAIRYVEYKSSTDTSNKFAEIMAGKNVIKRQPLIEIDNILIKKTVINDKIYIAKDGYIYEIDQFGKKILKGPGRILGQIINSEISREKIVLNEKAIKTSTLTDLIGNTLYGKSGSTYQVKKAHVVLSPSNKIENLDQFLITSNGDLLTANKLFIDKITHFTATKMSGGRIITANYIIEIPNSSLAIVKARATDVTTSYKNPKVIFEDNKWVVLMALAEYELDDKDKTINGVSFETKEVVSKNQFRFVDIDGSYILNEDDSPVFNLSDRTILRERVDSIETIDGNAFNYVYSLDGRAGQLTAPGVGSLTMKKDQVSYPIFNQVNQNTALTEKTIEISNKQILNMDEFILLNKNLKNIIFKTISGDDIKIISSSTILFNSTPVIISSGKFNVKLDIFIFELDENMPANDKKKIFQNSKIKRLERTIDNVVIASQNYYTDNIMVINYRNQKLIKLTSDDGLTIWTPVYSESVSLDDSMATLKIKPYYQTPEPALTNIFDISTVKAMSKAMSKDIIQQYKKYSTTPIKEKAISKSLKLQITNTAQLNSMLQSLNNKIKNIAGTNLSITKLTMNQAEIERAEDEKQQGGQFNFEIGQELSFDIKTSIEIAEGSSRFIYTDLNQSHYEDREGNTLSMISPVIVLEVTGDFNTNQVIFSPSKIVYTSLEGKRQTISLSSDATTLEYTEEDSDYVLSGVPAYYINQKVKELPTTVMLTSVQGVIDAMSSQDDILGGALSGIEGLSGSDSDSATADSFTDGVASGTSEGLKEIIDIYKQKAEGKQDILITDPNLELKAVFVSTTPTSTVE